MQIAFVLIFFSIVVANFTAFSGGWIALEKKNLKTDSSIDPAVQTFAKLHSRTLISHTARVHRAKMEKETVQKTMIRICNSIYQKGVWYRCPNAQSVHTTWAFAEEFGMEGSLANVWNGTTSDTFSCGSEADYGRYLLHSALDSDIVFAYRYDLNGISDGNGRTYPCGYSEIIQQL